MHRIYHVASVKTQWQHIKCLLIAHNAFMIISLNVACFTQDKDIYPVKPSSHGRVTTCWHEMNILQSNMPHDIMLNNMTSWLEIQLMSEKMGKSPRFPCFCLQDNVEKPPRCFILNIWRLPAAPMKVCRDPKPPGSPSTVITNQGYVISIKVFLKLLTD